MNHGKEAAFDKLAYLADNTEKDFLVSTCGYFIAENSIYHLHNRNYHNGYTLIYLHKGKAILPRVDGTDEIVTSGEVIIFHPYEYPKVTYLADAENERYYIYFEGSQINKCLTKFKLNDKRHYHVGDLSTQIKNFHKIIDDFECRGYYDDIHRNTLFLNILSAISNAVNPITKKSYPPIFKEVLDTIENNYFKKFSLQNLAKTFSISTSTLKRYFNKYTSKTPIDYINHIRLDRAKLMLVESNMSISEIAFNVGFDDALYFSKFFKKKIGVSPKKYREHVLNSPLSSNK